MTVVPVSKPLAICLVAIVVAGCFLGVTAGAARQGLLTRYYATPEWTGNAVVAELDDRVTTDTLAARMGDGTGAGFSARYRDSSGLTIPPNTTSRCSRTMSPGSHSVGD